MQKTVEVHTQQPYSVMIGDDLLSHAGELIRAVHPACKVVLVSDDTVAALYSQTVIDSLSAAGFTPLLFTFPHGEESKHMDTVMELTGFCSRHRLTRSDLIVALGGGVTGDMAGFAAAIYQRGIPFVQIPTTLLSMIDSSVGGKTAVNTDYGKNLIGSFWQPVLVLCDTSTLATLEDAVFAAGVAEAIKYGCIYDAGLFETFSTTDWKTTQLPDVIARCIEIKAEVVCQDELDTGLRRILNFGHTIGHAIEKQSKFGISHGAAVAVGMAEISRISERHGLTQPGVAGRLVSALRLYDLPTELDYDRDTIAALCLGDKKRDGGTLPFILLSEIGKCFLHPVRSEDVGTFLQGGNRS